MPINTFYTKCVGTHGAPGSGKSFIGQYMTTYIFSKGLRCLSTSVVARRSVHLGGKHIHKLFSLDTTKASLSPWRIAQLAIMRLQKRPVLLKVLQMLDVLFIDEAG